MALPHREWADLVMRTLVGHCDDNSFDGIGDFTIDHVLHDGYWGWFYEDTSAPDKSFWKWYVMIKSPGAELVDGMDEAIDYGMQISITVDGNTENCSQWRWYCTTCHYPLTIEADSWDFDLANGKYYDGVNAWGDYPQSGAYQGMYSPTLQYADRPYSFMWFIVSYDASPWGNIYSPDFVRNGFLFACQNIAGCDAGWTSGDYLDGHMEAQFVRINFLNPVVNSVSHRKIKVGETPEMVLTGLGFDQSNAELNDLARNPLNATGYNWQSVVDEVRFIGQQGQGTFTVTKALGEFTVDSDTQITIPSSEFPSLPQGSYHIQLFKNNVAGGVDVYAYAGDWNCTSEGLCSAGARLTFLVGEFEDEANPPGLFFKWRWKLGGLGVDEYYAPIDVRSPEVFYDGRVLSVSSVKRSIDDFTGMYNISDMEVELASADKHFQQNLALGHCKNQVVEIYQGWMAEPVSWHEAFFFGIVDDYTPAGPVFSAVLKDISRRNFRKQMPRFTITTDDYPDAHTDAVGRGIPELLGLHNWTESPTPGAIEALCIDTTIFRYVAAAAPIVITQVYSDNSLQTEGAGNDYVISYSPEGHTRIDFNADQEDKKVTFNCTGYLFAPWNSANGYVQNPARVLEFFLVFINEVPIGFIDTDSFNNLADQFDDNGYGEIGRWAGTQVAPTDSYLQELLFSFGIKMWPDNYGRFKVGRKDTTNFETDRTIWAQIEAMQAPERPYNLQEAISYVKARSDYQPASGMWRTALEREWGGAIEDYDERNEAAWDYPWVNDEDFLVDRIAEDLAKLAYGRKTVTFSVALDALGDLDIFDNFKLQDPYGISASGAGDIGRYYYITGLNYDWMNHTVTIEAEDLQWLAGQCFLIAHCDDIPDLIADASDWQQIFGYIGSCTTDAMPDGQPLKKICGC